MEEKKISKRDLLGRFVKIEKNDGSRFHLKIIEINHCGMFGFDEEMARRFVKFTQLKQLVERNIKLVL